MEGNANFNTLNFTIEKDTDYSISEAAEILGVTYRTLHYYEDKFELQINRDAGGQRRYSYENMKILEIILDAKKNGMSLDGIKKHLIKQQLITPMAEKDLIVIDENAIELQETLLQQIKQGVAKEIRKELQETNSMVKELIGLNKGLLAKNMELQEQLVQAQRQSNEHYNKIDQQLSAWREKQKPWYKRIISKE